MLLKSFDVSLEVDDSLFDGLDVGLESLCFRCSSLFDDFDFVTALSDLLIESGDV